MHAQVSRRLRIRHAAILDQPHRLKLELSVKFRRPICHLRSHDPPKLGVRETGSSSTIVGLTLISGATLVRADVITDWNKTAMDVMKAVNVAGNPWTRSMALVNVSMSDAVNSVQNRYSRYTTELPIDPNASAEAAAAGAAREILMRQYPGQKAKIDAAFAETMKDIPDSPARAAGIALGEKVAAAVFAERQSDATNMPDTYRPLTTPGVWVPTTPPLFPQYATAKPWGMDSASQFRPGPPPALNSALYARDYNETKEMGGAKSTKRTDAQSDAVRFWTQANLGPAWFQAAAQVSDRQGTVCRRESARVRTDVDGARQLLHRRLGRQIPVQLLAADHRDPQRRPGRQRRDRARRRLAASQRHADASGISVAGGHQRRCGERRSGSRFRQRAGRLRRNRHQRRTPVAPIRELRADGPGAQRSAHLGRHSFPQFARGGRRNGQEDRRPSCGELHEADAVGPCLGAIARRLVTGGALLLAAFLAADASEIDDDLPDLAEQIDADGVRGRARAAAPSVRLLRPRIRRPSTDAGASLFGDSALRRNLAPRLLWGRRNQDAGAALKDTNLTQFAPDVIAGLYLSLFMFSGEYTTEYVERERLYLIRLRAGFRNLLPPGQFPYPFWHEEAKWGVYQAANSVLLWVDPKTAKIVIGQFTERGSSRPLSYPRNRYSPSSMAAGCGWTRRDAFSRA